MANITNTQGGKPVGRAVEHGAFDGPKLDFATLLGAVGAFSVIALAMLLGGQPLSFVDLPALLIVLAGSFLVTTISFTWDEVVQAQGLMVRAAYSSFSETSPTGTTTSLSTCTTVQRAVPATCARHCR